ncbi:MAG: hypothetical protein DMF72_12510 [Acidobacteria bacterium]|nr:MAG: hypothetical protein DMF72_12510 [Acidobacteriota bacterium]
MTTDVAKYQFQSWARKGVSAHIKEPDTLGDPSAFLPPNERASVPIGVSINATPQPEKDFALIGPGDIIGVHRDMIVRTEPRNWITNVEPNYLAFIEFYDEDFAWRYTPAKPIGDRLRPWISLLVLKEDEFERDDRRLPLPVVNVKSKSALPPSDETWLFAHVHTEQDIDPGELSDLEKYLRSLQAAVTTDPDKIYCRLLSPRHLDPNTAYHAFLVPAFEVGRLAGLGQSTAGVPAQKAAWDAATTGVELPLYYDWYFNTGERQDFESLVEQLKPRFLDERIGVRSMDCSLPGFVEVDGRGRERPLAPGERPGLPPAAPTTQGLEGALKTERTQSLPLVFTPNDFQKELAILVNLPEEIQTDINAVPGSDADFLNDPVVTVPFYGQNHARQHKTDKILLNVSESGWYHDLNRDPRSRVPAGFGTGVIQKDQDKFMQKAWQQVERVYEGNRKIRNFQFIMQVSALYNAQFFVKLAPEKLLAVTTMVHAKVMGSPTTIRQQLLESRLKTPVFSAAFRRLSRPSGKLVQRLSGAGGPFDHSGLVTAINDGRITPAPPRGLPDGIPSVDGLAQQIQPRTFPAWLRWLMKNRLSVLIVALVTLLLLGIFGGAAVVWAIAAVLALAAVGGFFWLQRQNQDLDVAGELVDPEKAEASIRSVPQQPGFNIVRAGETGAPAATPGASAAADSVEARNFRSAAIDLQQRIVIRTPDKPALSAFDVIGVQGKLKRAIDPHVTFPFRLSAFVKIPGRSFDRPEDIVDAMAHPDFEEATYIYLRDINKELLIPNLQLIPPDTISILETNPKFIEAYMVGLNHEMGRELLWREFPTDLRGSYFRQFWEVKGVSNPDTPTDAEKLKDIVKIHKWPSTSELGSHKPDPGPNADVKPTQKQAVLVIRGELLKRYPNTVIYAQKAVDDGHGNNIIHEDLNPSQFQEELKFPLFRAEIDPDLRFFGFDLTVEQAKGIDASRDFENDHRGWFFVIQEVPGEPRFGMDIAYEPTRDNDSDPTNDLNDTWNNLAWNLFGPTEPAFIKRFPAPAFPKPGSEDLNKHIWARNSAEMAYSLFQTPVMVAVHASEMLDMPTAV